MKLKFTPEDFSEYAQVIGRNHAAAIAQALFDAWLESQPVVYGNREGYNWDKCQRKIPEHGIISSNFQEDTHRARLVAIEEIEKKSVEKMFVITVDPRMSPDHVEFRHPVTGEVLGRITNIMEKK